MRRVLLAAALVVTARVTGAAESVQPIGPEMILSEHEGGVDNAGLAGDDRGNFVVLWRRSGIHVVRVDPSGAVSAPLEPTTEPLAWKPRIAMRPAGDFVVTWHTDGGTGHESPSDLSGRLFDRSGAPGAEFQVHHFTELDGYYSSPAVAMDEAGGFVVVWNGYDADSTSGAFVRRFSAAAEPMGDAVLVNTDTFGSQYRPAIAADPSGGFIVSWTNSITTPGPDDDVSDVMARRFDASGAAVGPDFVANASTDGYQFDSSVGADDAGRFVVTWESLYGEYPSSREGVFARRFDAMGGPLAGEFRVDTGRHDLLALGWPQVAVDPAGGFAVVWGTGSILARTYDRDGRKLGPDFQVNTYTPGVQAGARVASSGTGEFLVTWSDYRGLIARRLGPRRIATELRLRDDADPAGRRLVVTPTTQVVSSTFGRPIDPTTAGAFLHVYNASGGGDSICLSLAAAHWSAKGPDPERATRFVYRDRGYVDGPCAKVVVANRKVVKASCKAKVRPIAFSLDEPAQGSVVVRLVTGSRAYCSVFGPEARVDEPGAFIAASGLPAGDCPAAPAPCP